MDEFTIFTAGERYPEHAGHPDGMEIHLSDDLVYLICYINHPRQIELDCFEDACTVHVGMLGALLYMTIYFGKWISFDQAIYPAEDCSPPHMTMPSCGIGYPLIIHAFDENGTLLKIRQAGLSTEISGVIMDLTDTVFSQPRDEAKIIRSIHAYSQTTTDQLTQLATCSYTLGDTNPGRPYRPRKH